MNEEKFEDDVINFCKLHNLDEGKRRKLQKIVKTQLIEMFNDGELTSFRGLNDYDEVLSQKNQEIINELNQEIEKANANEGGVKNVK